VHLELFFTLVGSFPVIALTLVGFAVIASTIKQILWPGKTGQKPRRRIRFSARDVALGLAFLPFAILYRPSLAEVAKAEIRQQEDADEDDNGDHESPVKHLLNQLRRIRRGERVETLSLHLK